MDKSAQMAQRRTGDVNYLRELGLKENERVYSSMIVGYPKSADGKPNRNPLPRKGNEVTFIN